MDKVYADTVRLLLKVAPAVFGNDMFAMKGGTAINLFVRDMPRLSVDILSGLTRSRPDWGLLQCVHASELPALRWKLANLQTFQKRRPDDFERQAKALDAQL